MKYAGLRLVAEREQRCTRCEGDGMVAMLGGGDTACALCDGDGVVVERTLLLHPGEPFFLVRGQDRHALATLYAYTGALVAAGAPQLHTPLGDGLARWFTEWQADNPGLVKTPD